MIQSKTTLGNYNPDKLKEWIGLNKNRLAMTIGILKGHC